ncbi:MAG TPA: hypothetical protein VFT41_01660 [Gemmatimonadaceae bacterium]|nr:hypothetical protein [Gemmatimonadaceae bacterium]
MSAMRRCAGGALVMLLGAAAAPLGAQSAPDPHAAQPERPTVATHAGTVAPGWFEIESGVERDHVGPDAATLATPTLLKFGIVPRVQLDVAVTTVRPAGSASLGVGDAGVGVKWRLADDVPLVGDFALQPSVKFPTGSAARGSGSGTTDVSLLAISSHEFGPTALDLNVGYTKRSDASASALWTVSTGTTIAGPLAWAAEVFGYPGLSGAPPSTGFLTGPTWTVHPWFVLDAGAIFNVAGGQPPAVYAGLTWNAGRYR